MKRTSQLMGLVALFVIQAEACKRDNDHTPVDVEQVIVQDTLVEDSIPEDSTAVVVTRPECDSIVIALGDLHDIGYTGIGILPDQGVNDPHIHIFNDKAYLFASHDAGTGNSDYVMDYWNVFSSQDLVHWEREYILRPEDTYIGEAIDKCFATDGASRKGKYYFYFSNHNKSTGVAVSDHPGGPYVDALGHALLPESIKGNKKYDPTIFVDDDDKHYIIWGYTGWGTYYQIAELNEDMISLKSEAKNLVVSDDILENDASYLHKHNELYYLSTHHGKYATSRLLYGPYTVQEPIEASGDHGTFFTWHNQTYYTAGAWQSPYFRYTFITYAHYKDNGEIVAQRVIDKDEELGVGRYDCSKGKIEAECYFAASDAMEKRENNSGFEMRNIKQHNYLFFPKVYNIPSAAKLSFRASCAQAGGATIEIRKESTKGELLATCTIDNTEAWDHYQEFECTLPELSSHENLYLVFKGDSEDELMRLDYFTLE